jgi:hypothetical protein
VPDEEPLRVEMDRSNEPKFVSADIEHVKPSPAGIHIVDAVERLLQFREIFETA